jgi:hypothetical protein
MVVVAPKEMIKIQSQVQVEKPLPINLGIKKRLVRTGDTEDKKLEAGLSAIYENRTKRGLKYNEKIEKRQAKGSKLIYLCC